MSPQQWGIEALERCAGPDPLERDALIARGRELDAAARAKARREEEVARALAWARGR